MAPEMDALRRLSKEVAAILSLSREEIRESAGYTNLRCLEIALEHAAEVLDKGAISWEPDQPTPVLYQEGRNK